VFLTTWHGLGEVLAHPSGLVAVVGPLSCRQPYLTRCLNYRCLILRPALLAVNPDLLTCSLALSDFGPQDWWFIPLPSHANSHPQHRQASQPDRTPASVSPFGVVPSQSVYAETDWAPVVLLGSCLGIRSDKPLSHRPHFPLPFGDRIPTSTHRQEENQIPSVNG